MPFGPEHDEWIREGLRKATLSLQIVPPVKGAAHWGCVEDLPVDVYHCDFSRHDPPQGFPALDVCCIRTDASWWIIFTAPLHEKLTRRAQAGELSLGRHQTVTMINERQIGAWLLMRDHGVTGEGALAQMERYLSKKYGEAYAEVLSLFGPQSPFSEAAFDFSADDYGSEPLEVSAAEDGDLQTSTPIEEDAMEPSKRPWRVLVAELQSRWAAMPRAKLLVVGLLLLFILVFEGPRMVRLYREVYGSASTDVTQQFSEIRWADDTPDQILQSAPVSKRVYQALTYRSPGLMRSPIQRISVSQIRPAEAPPFYRWTIHIDETATLRNVTVDMKRFTGRGMRALQTELSGYRSLRFILVFKYLMKWGHQGRFVVLFTLLCFLGLGLLVRRVIRQAQSLQERVAVKEHAAGSEIMEAVSQDRHVAENLMLFNQQRRVQGKESMTAWEQEAFDWVETNVDGHTGKTRRRQRDEALKDNLGGQQ